VKEVRPATAANPALLSVDEMIRLAKLRLELQVRLGRWALRCIDRLLRWPRVTNPILTVAAPAFLVLLWFDHVAAAWLFGLFWLAVTVWVIVVFAVAPEMSAEIQVNRCPTCGLVTGSSTERGVKSDGSASA
jgi:hypothetical protein